ncbi:MAG: hypothetical protein JRG73_03500 [Deltaproteobacteria bacterium]|nr:hypothetical protein [Deltaproteobacteria bacterium]
MRGIRFPGTGTLILAGVLAVAPGFSATPHLSFAAKANFPFGALEDDAVVNSSLVCEDTPVIETQGDNGSLARAVSDSLAQTPIDSIPQANQAPSDISFAVYALNSLVIYENALIRGGAVGTAITRTGRDQDIGPQVSILGAHVEGDVYGASVLLDNGATAERVFTNELFEGRSTHPTVLPYPAELPKPPYASPVGRGDTDFLNPTGDASSGAMHFLVPTGSRIVLAGNPARIVVQKKGILVLSGGEYKIEELWLGEGGRLEAEGPSRLLISQSLRTMAGSYIGAADRLPEQEGRNSNDSRGRHLMSQPLKTAASDNRALASYQPELNLSIVVAGTDRPRLPRAVIGEGSVVNAVLSVPNGMLELKERVTATGVYYGRDVTIGRGVFLQRPPGLDFRDDQCQIYVCAVEAVSGGSIQWSCGLTAAPYGAPCEDGNACTYGDYCDEAGQCRSGPAYPDPEPSSLEYLPCLRETCDPDEGRYRPEGTVCDVDVQCREPTTCNSFGGCADFGALLPEGTPCDDGIPNNGVDTCWVNGYCYGSLGQFDCLANNCSNTPNDPPDLECWLNEHPHIRNMIRTIQSNSSSVPWADWEPWRKQQLQQAFEDAWQWYADGMTNFQGTPVPEPPPNHEPLADGGYVTTVFDEAMEAWPLYLAYTAHTLAVEIGGWVPWSLCDYDANSREMRELLSGPYIYWTSGSTYPGLTVRSPVTYAHPTLVFTFLVQNNLIGSTRLETITNVLNWCRKLQHFIGPFVPENMEYHWQYRGLPPVSRIISGTNLTDPALANAFPDPEHWTRGCWGTSGFIKQLLRTVNIPVVMKSVPNNACPHATPYFITEGLYLSHGDDPYDLYQEGTTSVAPPMIEFLIDQTTYTNWFEGDPGEACDNIARRPVELAVWWLPDRIVYKYCNDIYYNLDHASGSVYQNYYSRYYTVEELEATDLWGRLSQQATALGYWCGGM